MIETSNARQVCSTKTLAFGLLISALALCLALPAVSYGQASAGTGSFSGVLTDPSGAVVPGAEVEAGLAKLFALRDAAYVHIHNAKRGCYSCRVERG